MPVTASQLKTRLAELLEVSKKEADNILAAFEQVMTEVVKDADSVMIPGVGKLDCVVAPSRKARNPATGESIMTKPKVNVKFRVSTSLKNSAPSLKSKTGKKLLAAAEAKQVERDKAKRKRERLAAKNGDSGTKKSKGKSKALKTKSGTKKSKAKSGRRF
jgi:nucleoid DNA-binding protein